MPIGDDAAILKLSPTSLLVITTDQMVEGVHFERETHPPGLLGEKALSVNLSDFAAMGCSPSWALLSLFLPPELSLEYLEAILRGMARRARRAQLALIGGEFEPGLVAAAERAHKGLQSSKLSIHRGKVDFLVPQRANLPPLARYARLILPDGAERTVGFAEASRGCKHWCRHCPVVPVYQGRFRAVPAEIVLADIRQQVAQGAQHIAFGDPDFLNGPTHALRIVRALHAEFPALTWDATIKIQHLVEHAALLPELKR
ncbi:MAG: AIR synthase related protein, partial [Acidobacteria bacterium]|nr:AIR synthase related protein [Acidobacteriota bacterium]